jgi:CHAT domain-containing protein
MSIWISCRIWLLTCTAVLYIAGTSTSIADTAIPPNPKDALDLAQSDKYSGNLEEARRIYLEVVATMAGREPDPLARSYRARAALGLADLYLLEDKFSEAEAPSRQALAEAVNSTDYTGIAPKAAIDLQRSLAGQSRGNEALHELLAVDAELKRRGVSGTDDTLTAFHNALAAAEGSNPSSPGNSFVQVSPNLMIGTSSSKILNLLGMPLELLSGLGPDAPPDVLAKKLRVIANAMESRFGAGNPVTGEAEIALGAALLKANDPRGAFDTTLKGEEASRDVVSPDAGSLNDILLGKSMQSAVSATLTRSVLALGGIAGAPTESDTAFQVYQRSADSETQRALRISAGVRHSGNRALANLMSRREAALAQKKEIISAIEAGKSAGLDGGSKALEAADHEIKLVDQSVARDFPRFSGLFSAQPVGLAEARSFLRADEALLAYQITKDGAAVWVLRQDRADIVDLAAKSQSVAELVMRLRASVDWLGEEKHVPFDLDASYALYKDVFEPIEKDLDGVKRLLVVPDGPLGTIPFHLLLSEPPPQGDEFERYRSAAWLLRKYDFATLPGVSTIRVLRGPHTAASDREPFLGFGDPVLAPREAKPSTRTLEIQGGTMYSNDVRTLPSLPETGDELRAIAKALSSDPGRLYLGEKATISELHHLNGEGALARSRVVVFATHALIASSGEDGSREAGLVFTPPPVGQENATDNGFLSSSDVLGLHFNADWIVLSACNTAADSAAGDRQVSGLARAFFYAGTDALLISHWNVASLPAERMMTMVFQKTARGEDKAHALSEAMISLIDDPHQEFSQPAIWAPFFVMGD